MKKAFTCRSRLINHCLAKMKIIISPHLALLLAMLMCVSAYAQNTGSVQWNRSGTRKRAQLTTSGVSVTIKGTTYGVNTDVSGKFSLNADKGATLVFSFVGYAKKEVVVGDETTNVSLSQATSNLNEVVVVGYGEQKKLSLTTAVSSVQSKDIITTKNENVENMLNGKVAGLQVMQNTAEPGDFNNNISIRGYGTNPLVVIDVTLRCLISA